MEAIAQTRPFVCGGRDYHLEETASGTRVFNDDFSDDFDIPADVDPSDFHIWIRGREQGFRVGLRRGEWAGEQKIREAFALVRSIERGESL